jgi:hypothetical protein
MHTYETAAALKAMASSTNYMLLLLHLDGKTLQPLLDVCFWPALNTAECQLLTRAQRTCILLYMRLL